MVSVNLTINVNGDYSTQEIDQKMFVLGELIINKIKENIRDMKLVQSGALLQGWFSSYSNGQLTIENTQPWMLYLEFGTYGYWDAYGPDKHPQTPDPKKKDMPSALRKLYPKGMQPFAFIRKVLYNNIVMNNLVSKAFS